MRSYEDLKNPEILDRVQSRLRPERSTIEKIFEKLFTKKLVSNPNAIAKLSLSLAATSKMTGKALSHDMGATAGLLSVGLRYLCRLDLQDWAFYVETSRSIARFKR